MTRDARELLVKNYRFLRGADANASTKSSYRITVRQLESMVRLSEALAKLYSSNYVTTRHVQEACGLLQKSMMYIQQDDVELDATEEETTEVPDTMEVDPPTQVIGI